MKIEGISKNNRVRLDKDDDDVSDGEIDDDVRKAVGLQKKENLKKKLK